MAAVLLALSIRGLEEWKHRSDRLLEQIKRWLTDPIVTQVSGQALLLVLGVILSLPQLELLTREPHMLRLPLQRERQRKRKTLNTIIQSFSFLSLHIHMRVCFGFVGKYNVLLLMQHYFEATDYCHSTEKHRWIDSFATFLITPQHWHSTPIFMWGSCISVSDFLKTLTGFLHWAQKLFLHCVQVTLSWSPS